MGRSNSLAGFCGKIRNCAEGCRTSGDDVYAFLDRQRVARETVPLDSNGPAVSSGRNS